MKICKCGHPKKWHNPSSENYDADWPCEGKDPDGRACTCEDFEEEDAD